MHELYKNKIFNLVLLITIIGEFLLPFILKYFYRGYDSKTMVMSVLGSPESPVKIIYNIWLIWLGIFLLLSSFVIFSEKKKDVSGTGCNDIYFGFRICRRSRRFVGYIQCKRIERCSYRSVTNSWIRFRNRIYGISFFPFVKRYCFN